MTRLLREERGLAMVAVMGALLVTSILAFAVAATAQRNSDASVSDTNSKRALAAAEAGVNVGRFKVGKVFGNTATATNDARCYPTSCGWSAPEEAGNGVTYRYTVSPVLSTGATCGTPYVTVPLPNARERCVTAIGEVNGVRRQLQTRVVENRGAPLFPFPGMFGLHSVNLNQSKAHGTVGSNGSVTIGPGSRVENPGHVVLGERNEVDGTVSGPYTGTLSRREEFVADNHDVWYSNARQTNANGTLPNNTVDSGRNANPPNGHGTITLTPGRDYNFCSIAFNSNEKFVVPANASAPVRIFVDAPPRPESMAGVAGYVGDGCSTPTKAIDAASGSGFDNKTNKASMLQVYVYSGAIEFHASAEFVGTLWAPNSDVLFNSDARLRGAMVARNIQYNNNGQTPGFVGDGDANNVGGSWDGSYRRNGWRECSPNRPC